MRSCPVRSKHLPLEDIRHLSTELTELGYQVRFAVNGFFFTVLMSIEFSLSTAAAALQKQPKLLKVMEKQGGSLL